MRAFFRSVCLWALALVIGWSEPPRTHAEDAIDRLQPDRLEKVHQAVVALRDARREVPRVGSLREYRVNLHVHSKFSHDSRGQIDEIVAAARKAGTQVLMFTEHPADHYDFVKDGHQGLNDGVLLIPGAEMKGMLVYPRESVKSVESLDSQDLSLHVRGRSGLTFLSHLEERMDWELKGLTGVEIYNTHADAKEEKRLFASVKNPLWLIQTAKLFDKYPQEAMSALLDYPENYLKRWDELCAIAPHTGVSANDAHQNIGLRIKVAEGNRCRVEDALGQELLMLDRKVVAAIRPIPDTAQVGDVVFQMQLDPYENSLRHVGTHVLASDLTRDAISEALERGRAFVAFDWIADSRSFDWAAAQGTSRFEMGSAVPLAAGLKLVGQSPLPGHWRIFRSGKLIHEADGDRVELPVMEVGHHRAELWLDLAGERQPWILSNPIYVRAAR
jgi:hypothetical protein